MIINISAFLMAARLICFVSSMAMCVKFWPIFAAWADDRVHLRKSKDSRLFASALWVGALANTIMYGYRTIEGYVFHKLTLACYGDWDAITFSIGFLLLGTAYLMGILGKTSADHKRRLGIGLCIGILVLGSAAYWKATTFGCGTR